MEGFCTPERRPLVLIAAVLASSMGFIDGTVVSIAIPAIRNTLGATLGEATWINNAYMVTLAALILVGGAFGDRFGLARVFTLGIGLFVVTSAICALAPSPDILILARGAQGAGAALMIPGSLAIISRAYPRELRGGAIGTWAAASAVTTAMGPLIGGLTLAFGGDAMWRWIFAINLPLGVAAILLTRAGIRRDAARPGEPIDLRGAALAVFGLGTLAWALTHAESGEAGRDAAVAAVIGGAAVAAFLWHEHRTAHAMMPLSLFASRTFSAANAATFSLYFGLSAILFFLPMLVIAGWGVAEIEAAFAFAPLSAAIFLFSRMFGRLADRIGGGPLVGVGSAIAAAAYAWLAVAVESREFWTGVLPPMMLMGFGMSMVVAPISATVMGAVRDDQSGLASGVNNAISRIAGLIAVAAMSSVVSLSYREAGGPETYGIAADAPGHGAAMVAAFATVAWVAAGLSALSSVLALAGIRLPGDAQTGS